MTATDVAILDYGAGNVASVAKAFRHIGARPAVTAHPDELAAARAIVVPGVGHFERTTAIDASTRDVVLNATAAGASILGICLGLHWLCEGSEESARSPGLGVLAGRCRPLQASGDIKIPHIGWNALERTDRPSRLLEGVHAHAHVYFCHSFAAPRSPETTAVSHHGSEFSAVVENGRVFGVQFHPEKSGEVGLRVLRNFLRICEGAD